MSGLRARHALFPKQGRATRIELKPRGEQVQPREVSPPEPATPSAGAAMVRLQLMAMIGMGCHYTARGSADGVYGQVCRAATITEALDLESGVVGLAVMNPTGLFFHQEVAYDPAGAPGTWHWPERV